MFFINIIFIIANENKFYSLIYFYIFYMFRHNLYKKDNKKLKVIGMDN